MKTIALTCLFLLSGCAASVGQTHVTYTTPGVCDFGLEVGTRVQVRSEDGEKTVIVSHCSSEVALLSL